VISVRKSNRKIRTDVPS
jgi:hypothetical protein